MTTVDLALPVCSRCRKRRIKCDIQLPACKNCRLADVECSIWDSSLAQEIPCSYLHTLQQKTQDLQSEIEKIAEQGGSTSDATTYEIYSLPFGEQDHHLNLAAGVDVTSSSQTFYLGPGTSARLVQRLFKGAINWCLSENLQIPEKILSNERQWLPWCSKIDLASGFPLLHDPRKLELHSFVPPSTQRALIEHYLKVVAPEFALITQEQVATLLTPENPLKWAASNKNDPAAFALGIVFAISAALLARDVDHSLASVALRSRAEVHRLSSQDQSDQDSFRTLEWNCAAFCALAIYELIWPTTDQLCDLLGKATATMEDLRESCHFEDSNLQVKVRRLEHVLLKIESLAIMHFKRLSFTFDIRLKMHLQNVSYPGASSDQLHIASHLRNISQVLATSINPNEIYLESLIPPSLQVSSHKSRMDICSAILYSSLHPIFTNVDLFASNSVPSGTSWRVIQIIAESSSTIIDHFTQLNKSNKIISLWLAAERVLEAGAIWVAYLFQRRSLSASTSEAFDSTDTGAVMNPILKVSSLLASFTARWKAGSIYVSTWEALTEILLKIL